MKLTKELLKKNGACKDAIAWCERNKLFGFPLDRLDEITGDFDCYVSWLKARTFNEQGLVIREILPSGHEWKYEYDSNGNMIREILSDGGEWKYEYDSRGNRIRGIHSSGQEWKYEYEYYDNGQLKRVNDLYVPLFG